jgi:hypothetical protein
MYALLLLLILGSYACALLVWRHQRTEINQLNAEMSAAFDNQTVSQGPIYTDATISPSENMVYLPLARLKLPGSPLAESFVYTHTGPYTIPGDSKIFPANLSISTHAQAANDSSTTHQFDCTSVAYADFVTPSYPINPMWKTDGTTKLADGRKMNVYYAPSISGCQTSWQMNNINPKAIADLLREAVSY